MERVEDTYAAMKAVAEDIDLASRNYNDEIIGIDYYQHLEHLSQSELDDLIPLWQFKRQTCVKERLASVWMVIQIMLLITLAMFIAWLSGGFAGIFTSIIGVIAMIAMIEDKRVAVAKRNLADAERVCQRLQTFKS